MLAEITLAVGMTLSPTPGTSDVGFRADVLTVTVGDAVKAEEMRSRRSPFAPAPRSPYAPPPRS